MSKMEEKKKINYLVVDTTGFIKNCQFQEMANNIITAPCVTREITSKSQLRRLAVLPYDLEVREAFPEHIKHVSDFAKKTGDYASLSATDIQVIALAYQLEKEHVGVDHLRTEPLKRPVTSEQLVPQEFRQVAGFFTPKIDESEATEEASEDVENIEEGEADDDWCDADNGEEDDDEGWITPGNVKEMKQKILSEVVEDVVPVVGCLTTDFAMQNVLKQIGLNVVSLEGRVIRELRTFILRCYACFKTTSVMSKIFCPNCGNKTLKKVAVTTNPDGTQQIHINFRKPLTSRGKRFSTPTFKGGKHSNNPILFEDQPTPQQRESRLSRIKNNPLDDDYIAGFSPFVTRDVNSRSALLGIRPHAQIKQWMRRNPNECTKSRGRKQK